MACFLAAETPVAQNEDRMVTELRDWADNDPVTLDVARRLTVKSPRAHRLLDRARRDTGGLSPRATLGLSLAGLFAAWALALAALIAAAGGWGSLW
jgi:hypothetical protein